MNKKAISTIVSVVLLLLVAVATASGVYVWFTSFQEEFVKKQQFTGNSKKLEILGVQYVNERKALLGLKNLGESYHIVEKVQVGNQECDVVGTNVVEEVSNVFIECPTDLDTNYELNVVSNRGTSSKAITSFEIGPDTQSNFVFNNLSIEFKNSNVCEVWQTKLFGMHDTNQSHAEIASQSNFFYSVCANHSTYAITTDCLTNHSQTIFTLGDITNSHVYTNTSQATPELPNRPYNFNEICLNTLGESNINITFATSRPEESFTCIASIQIDNLFGGVIGDCTNSGTKIWGRIESAN